LAPEAKVPLPERVNKLKKEATKRAKAVRRAALGLPPAQPPKPAAQPAGKPPGNPLRAYFDANEGRQIYKWMHYFDIYHRHFAKFRGKEITVVEFGVFQGGSLQMWRDYFGPKAHIVGVDINPQCADMADGQTEIIIGDQEDREFLRALAERLGKIHVVIDDGGHTMQQQINTFEELWPRVTNGGVFLVEDLHTSYIDRYGGGYKRPGTFIEYAKDLIDQQHAWHAGKIEELNVDEYTRSIRGMHVYDSIIAFDKATVKKPFTRKTGTPSV
jgi:cephalosporin hydroxylase